MVRMTEREKVSKVERKNEGAKRKEGQEKKAKKRKLKKKLTKTYNLWIQRLNGTSD